MEILKINKQQFDANEEFFKKNLAYVYDLYENQEFAHLSEEEIDNRVLKGFQKFFEEDTKNNFLAIAIENCVIYSMVAFEHNENNYWYVDSMATRSERRGEHLATKVLEKGLSEISGKCYLHVDKDNIPALKLYQKLGFSVDNTLLEGYENLNNSYLLSKDLRKEKKDDKQKQPEGEYIIC